MRLGFRSMTSIVMLCAGSLLAATCAEPSLSLTDEDGQLPDGDFIAAIGTSISETYTITNSGQADALLRYVILDGGTPFGPFSLGGTCQSNGVIPANGGSCTLVVTFTPKTEFAEGAAVRVNYYWEGAAFFEDIYLPVQGAGLLAQPPALSDGPSYDFGELQVRTAGRKTFSFKNTSQAHFLQLGAVSDRGLGLNPPFSLAESTCESDAALAPQESCSLTVAFTPTAEGEFSDSIDLQFRLTSSAISQVASRRITGAGYVD